MIGTTLGQYRIVDELGRGGMGVVYKAEDQELKRIAALKVLPTESMPGVEERLRFIREAQSAARLNHPNVAVIYGIHEEVEADNGKSYTFIAQEYVDGDDLVSELRDQPIPIERILELGIQIAEGLEAAHAKGIIHRDIKPSNVMIGTDGRAKILDFGLAKHEDEAPLTREGSTLGTVAYMSPEQARGESVDRRSDIWSLGVLLYELIAGKRPFRGIYDQAVIYAILNAAPDSLSEHRPDCPEALVDLVQQTLSKNPDDRPESVDDIRIALLDLQRSLGRGEPIADVNTGSGAVRARPVIQYAGMGILGLLVVLLAAKMLVGLFAPGEAAAPALTKVTPLSSFAGMEWSPSFSPDGSQIAYSHVLNGTHDVFVMPITGGNTVPVATGIHDEVSGRWSPEGSKIAFLSDRGRGAELFWVPPTGGTERKIADTFVPYLERWSATYALGAQPWSPDGSNILFSRLLPAGSIAVFSAVLATDEITQITFPEDGVEDLFATRSMDGNLVAYTREEPGKCSIVVLPARGGREYELLDDIFHDHGPVFTADNEKIIFFSNRSGSQNLWELTIETRELRQLTTGAGYDFLPVIRPTGEIAYVNFGHRLELHTVNVEDPEEEHVQLTSHSRNNYFPRYSPDGQDVVYQSDRTGNDEIWVLDTETLEEVQLTSDAALDRTPDWSPDGEQIVFVSNRDRELNLWIMDRDGRNQRKLTDHTIRNVGDVWAGGRLSPRWSPDGRKIGFISTDGGTETLWTVNPDGSGAASSGLKNVLRFDWYLDSSRVIYGRQASDGSGSVETYARDLETGEEILLMSGMQAELIVEKSGESIAYLHAPNHVGMNLYRLFLDTSDYHLPRAVGNPIRLTEGRGYWHVHGGSWSPDGKTIVYTRDTDESDIFMLETLEESGRTD